MSHRFQGSAISRVFPDVLMGFSLLLSLICLSHPLHAQSDKDRQRLNEIRAEMLKHRVRLETGSFSVIGTKTEYDERRENKEFTTRITIHQVFDRPGGRFHQQFQSEELSPAETGQQSVAARIDRHQIANREASRLIQNSHYVADWYSRGTVGKAPMMESDLNVRDSWKAVKPLFEGAVDPRAVGFIDDSRFRMDKSLEDIWTELNIGLQKFELTDLGDGITQLTFWYAHVCRKIQIDTAHGFTIRHLEVWNLDSDGKLIDPPYLVGKTSWKLINQTWVPVDYTIRYEDSDVQYETRSYWFTWETVNPDPDTFDSEQFTYRATAGLKPGTQVYDQRGIPDLSRPVLTSARPRLLGIVGPNGEFVEGGNDANPTP